MRTARACCTQAQVIEITPALVLALSWNAHEGQEHSSLLLHIPPSLVTTGSPHQSHTESLFLPKWEVGRVLTTHRGDQEGACSKPLLHSVLSKQSHTAAPCRWEASYTDLPTGQAQRWKNRECEVCRCFEVLLWCEVPLHIQSTIHSFSDLFF